MDEVLCNFCGKKHKRKKSQLRLSKKHYCSGDCSSKARRNGKSLQCFICKKIIYKSLKDLKNSKSKKYFCSTICSNKWIGKQQRSNNHPNWKGGMSSYKNILKRTKNEKKCFLCNKNDVRILCVHHIDKNRKNNNIKNLTWLCRNCHFLVHNYSKDYDFFL